MLAAQQRADDSELELQVMSQQSETRAVGLESRLSELSETLGSVERLRQQDQQIIQKLRERLVQVCFYAVSQKNVPTLASCSFDKHRLILIILGKQRQQFLKVY